MKKFLRYFIIFALIGLVVAIIHRFDNDPFAAAQWAISWIWHWIEQMADLWSNNDGFKKATKKPS